MSLTSPTTRRCLPPCRRGFTLVELLVVVAIIALLASLAIPYLGRAGEQTRLAMCRANLRAMGTGLAAYVGACNSSLPVAEQLDNPHGDLIEALHPQYVGQAESFYCPAQTDPKLAFSRENFDANQIGYFYYCCRKATRNRGVSTFLRWHVPWPRILDERHDSDTWVMSDAWFSGEPTSHRWYKKCVNYLTLGGEVRTVTTGPRKAFK